ncbi:MAG TPA: polysaccharide deacetylase family protein [Acidiferrobacterales bacterium]|nr:polysaccharide deacetylase family protein [Acidiferrobacterales bacterium]
MKASTNAMRTTYIVTILLSIVAVWLTGCSLIERAEPAAHEIVLPYEPPRLKLTEPPSLPPLPPEIVFHGPRDAKLIALTFDACATRALSHYDERITQVLVEKKVPATLFLGGKWIEENLDHARYLASLPQFELGNHTFLHPHLTQVSDARLRDELAWTQAVLYTVTGRQATVFRAPYGEYDRRIVRFAAEMGLTTIQYDLASGDPDLRITKDRLITSVIERVRPGSIVVMHINRRGWHTAEALPGIIDALRQKGFTFVTVGELLASMNSVKTGAEVVGLESQ